MKKLFFVLVTAALFLLSFSPQKSYAQTPYKASVGAMLYGNAAGPSFKFFFTEHIAFQTDILFRGTLTGDIVNGFVWYLALETNTNVMYQKKFKDKETYELFWLMGGEISLGYQLQDNGKFGVNAITGLELCAKKIPLAFQMDLRPGYAMLFTFDNYNPIFNDWFHHIEKNPWSHFDWLITFTLRYTI